MMMHFQTHPLDNATNTPAVLTTKSITVQINSPKPPLTPSLTYPSMTKTSQPAVIDVPIVPTCTNVVAHNSGMRNVELSTGRIREGFANGDIIVTLLPVNTQWPWITPAKFRPELVPEELMAQGLTVRIILIFVSALF